MTWTSLKREKQATKDGMGLTESRERGVHDEQQKPDAGHTDSQSNDSHDSESGPEQDELLDPQHMLGYRVMKVFEGSPAADAGLLMFEDYVFAVGGKLVQEPDAGSLADLLAAAENEQVQLSVWSSVHRVVRFVSLVPRAWKGPGLLGAAVKYEPMSDPFPHVMHVTNVAPNSPGADAGLMPKSDYLVGTRSDVFRNERDLEILLRQAHSQNAILALVVYSSATGRFRSVEVSPNNHWGGRGILGCELSTGLFHEIPVYSTASSGMRKVSSAMYGSQNQMDLAQSSTAAKVTREEQPQKQAEQPPPARSRLTKGATTTDQMDSRNSSRRTKAKPAVAAVHEADADADEEPSMDAITAARQISRPKSKSRRKRIAEQRDTVLDSDSGLG
ncbi:Golgi reassembly-stacking protein 1 [Porphyridium purpureum]|uniref:Golgi reassembly-stacking protein 1 n=1 Tax=Porphyridium purpureum TaxID=35688 RepID=A0A5J4Z8A4_PORPP|nr:Golgi reassembly-stacking protein 1 [Porphyridium purpureum]|eukprot:POR6198..scf295_1